ncbi:hypothetical protein [Helicobacter suis]|uniref:hypothetical protein n=1 Tax=Helicobacter suis TaxID=104628 RepID=UPI0013D00846|nr:hypothetical protein [Helicobacter suis]
MYYKTIINTTGARAEIVFVIIKRWYGKIAFRSSIAKDLDLFLQSSDHSLIKQLQQGLGFAKFASHSSLTKNAYKHFF